MTATATTTMYIPNTSSISSSLLFTDDVYNTPRTALFKSQQILPKHQIHSQHLLPRKSLKNILVSSDDSYTSSKTNTSILSTEKTEIFRQRIEQEYNTLQQNEAYHRCYIENPFDIVQAHDQLGNADDGIYITFLNNNY
jgi:hypothetical protein